MSAASAETFALLDRGEVLLGLTYCLGTLAASVLAVLIIEGRLTHGQRRDVAGQGGGL